ncbi:hypothetical protein NEOLEDRAFT_1145880 [Neolentinus lepideus HHB14362 ss-1]|uniref:Uncharacterized protein n=1 Tax=Neolentinus lepideus HHB14362 ss-1 TaxID=1314782 RepID=A0A165UJC2_9AGAM|nr:hypothetical protein NEOLEDRAFT_1145880 [Neolentinus lepideus HHB14362 ss-1]
MKTLAAIFTTLLAVSLAANADCAICPPEIDVEGVTYYCVAANGSAGEPEFCSYNSNPNGGPNMTQVCWYSTLEILVILQSPPNPAPSLTTKFDLEAVSTISASQYIQEVFR